MPEATKIRLIAVDLDGTLLTSAKRISARSADVLRQARRQGAYVVLATARPPRSVLPYYDAMDLDSPMINYNGALVYEPSGKRVLMHRPISAVNCRKIVALARRLYPRVLVSAEVLDSWFTDRLDGRYATETAKVLPPNLIAPVDQWLDRAVTKLMLLGKADKLTMLAKAIHRRFLHQVTMVQTEGHLLQIMHATVSKAQALRVVAGELGVDREAVLAIGDNANDIGMIQWAGVGVAVGNAAAVVKSVADLVVEDNDSDGPAKAIEHFVLKKGTHSP